MEKIKYVQLSKPLRIRKFKEFEAPIGWLRIESVLINKLKDLTKSEIKTLNQEVRNR
jgi:hypothetical protein